MLNCREFVKEADQLLAGELSRRQRLAARLHLLICRHCRRYLRQLRLLLRAVPFMHRWAADEEVTRVMNYIRDAEGGDH